MQLQQFTLKQHFVLFGVRILPFLYLQLVGNFPSKHCTAPICWCLWNFTVYLPSQFNCFLKI